MPLVPRFLTNVHIDSLRSAQHAAYHIIYGVCPAEHILRVGWCHNVLELGLNQETLNTTGLWRFNVGNIDASWLDRLRLDVYETVLEREMRPDGTWYRHTHRRRAYPTLGAGCIAYWEKMRRYSTVMATGDTADFAEELKSRGYYTGKLEDYRNQMRLHGVRYDLRYAGEPMADMCGWLE